MPDYEKLSQCTITLTRECNLRCSFCYAKKTEYQATATISYDSLKRIVDFCIEADVKFIVFTGGEPSLYSHLIDILKYIQSRNQSITVAMATNGLRLSSSEFCNKLYSYGIRYFDISLKGMNPDECYRTTGKDCFLQQLAAVQNLSQLPVEFTCSIVLTHNNISSLCETVKQAKNKGARQFSFTFIIDNEQSNETGVMYLKRNDPFNLVQSFIRQTDRLNEITSDWWVEYSFPMCLYTEDQLALLQGKLATSCQIHIGNSITFDTESNLIPCNMHFENTMGQLDNDFSTYEEFLQFIQSPKYKSVIDKLRHYPSSLCKDCKYLELCYGGCPVLWKNYSFDDLCEFRNYRSNIAIK